MTETLKTLQDFANLSDNVWLINKLSILETEIQISILNAEIEIIKTKL